MVKTQRQDQLWSNIIKGSRNLFTHTIVIEIADGKIQLCVVSQFPPTDDVQLLGREESTDTLGANFIRSKERYFFTAVL